MRVRNRSSLLYTALQFTYWAECAFLFGYLVAFLQGRGLSNTQIGVSAAGGRLISLLLTPFLSSLLDRRKISFRTLACIVLVIEIVSAAMIILYTPVPLLMLSCIVCICCSSVAGSLYVILAAEMRSGEDKVNFAFSRAAGSAAFAVCSFSAGMLMKSVSPQVIPIAGVILTAVQLVLCCMIRLEAVSAAQDGAAREEAKNSGLFSRSFIMLLVAIVLLFTAHSTEGTFMVNIVNSAGGDLGDLSRLNLYIALLEIPTMLIYSFLKKSSARKFLIISIIFYPVKMLAVSLASSVPMIYAAMAFQMLSFALYTPAVVEYISDISNEKTVAGMQFYASSAALAGMVLAPLAGGILLDALPLKTVLFIMSAVSVTGAVLGVLAVRDAEKKKGIPAS